MVERAGLRGTEHDGVFFSEASAPEGAETLRRISVRKSRQNLSLAVIKTMMASEARAAGANAIVEFTYGQRAHKLWEQVFTFKWDTEEWYGDGLAVVLPAE